MNLILVTLTPVAPVTEVRYIHCRFPVARPNFFAPNLCLTVIYLFIWLVDSAEEAIKFYNDLLKRVNSGMSLNKALKKCGKQLNTLKRVEAFCQLNILKPALYEEVSWFIVKNAFHNTVGLLIIIHVWLKYCQSLWVLLILKTLFFVFRCTANGVLTNEEVWRHWQTSAANFYQMNS